jgi:hypothetical protein
VLLFNHSVNGNERNSEHEVECPFVELVGQECPADEEDERYVAEWYPGGTQIQIRPNISLPNRNFRGLFQSP